ALARRHRHHGQDQHHCQQVQFPHSAAFYTSRILSSLFARLFHAHWRIPMQKTLASATLTAAVLVLAFAATTPTAAPVRLARHPDYHAGTLAFSYLGDIWTASEDGSRTRRVTDHRAREVYPRFSPDGRMIAFSSNRYGNYDVFVVPATGGTPKRLTFHTGTDDVVGWTRDSQNVIFRSARGDGAFPSVSTMYQVAVSGGQEKPLPVDW